MFDHFNIFPIMLSLKLNEDNILPCEQQKLEAIDGSSVMVGLEWGHDKVKDTRGRVRDWKFNLVINLKDDFYKVVIVSLK